MGKKNEPIEIRYLANGFIVTPRPRPENTREDSEYYVFESYEGLFEHIKKNFGPPEGDTNES